MLHHRVPLIPRNHSALLTTESAKDFDAIRADLRNEIRPTNTIERIYCDDVAYLLWDIVRWRRWKLAILKLAFGDALYEVLVERLGEFERGPETVAILDKWFTDANLRAEISGVLAKYKLDESVIEAAAFRRCSADVMRIEQLLAAAELRRDKALHAIAFYRQSLAHQLRDQAIQVMHDKDVQHLEFKSSGNQK